MFPVLDARILTNRNNQYITSKVGLSFESETMVLFPCLTLNTAERTFFCFVALVLLRLNCARRPEKVGLSFESETMVLFPCLTLNTAERTFSCFVALVLLRLNCARRPESHFSSIRYLFEH
jgi:hypothetical protein